jgi:hypothetical protein
MIDLADLCEALAADIESGSWTHAPSSVAWDYDLEEELGNDTPLRVTVVPSAEEPDLESRGTDSYQLTVTVFIQRKPKELTKANLKPPMVLARELCAHYLGASLTVNSERTVHCLAARVAAPVHYRHYRELRQFTWAVQLTFTQYE